VKVGSHKILRCTETGANRATAKFTKRHKKRCLTKGAHPSFYPQRREGRRDSKKRKLTASGNGWVGPKKWGGTGSCNGKGPREKGKKSGTICLFLSHLRSGKKARKIRGISHSYPRSMKCEKGGREKETLKRIKNQQNQKEGIKKEGGGILRISENTLSRRKKGM